MEKILTPQGYRKMQQELKNLKEEKLPDIIDKIERAKEMGDLSENAEYHDAKDQQGLIVSRIHEIEKILKSATVSDEAAGSDNIAMGSTFVVEDMKGIKKEYTIVGYNEADPLVGRISNESPMGEAFIGKKAGDMVEVDIPKGLIRYKIVEIK